MTRISFLLSSLSLLIFDWKLVKTQIFSVDTRAPPLVYVLSLERARQMSNVSWHWHFGIPLLRYFHNWDCCSSGQTSVQDPYIFPCSPVPDELFRNDILDPQDVHLTQYLTREVSDYWLKQLRRLCGNGFRNLGTWDSDLISFYNLRRADKVWDLSLYGFVRPKALCKRFKIDCWFGELFGPDPRHYCGSCLHEGQRQIRRLCLCLCLCLRENWSHGRPWQDWV